MSNKKKVKRGCYNCKAYVLKCSTRTLVLLTSFKLPPTPQGTAELLACSCLNVLIAFLKLPVIGKNFFFEKNCDSIYYFFYIQNFLQKIIFLKWLFFTSCITELQLYCNSMLCSVYLLSHLWTICQCL